MKIAKYAVLALALLVPVVAYASTSGCDCPCCPIKGSK